VAATGGADWRQVLYRGASGTATGEYVEGEGSFKILAMPPVPPPQHNRRASDRVKAEQEAATAGPH
jgi:hypothetical protein